MPKRPCDTPIQAVAEHGEVLIDGPDGLVSSLTPQAAKKSADELHQAARRAEQGACDA